MCDIGRLRDGPEQTLRARQRYGVAAGAAGPGQSQPKNTHQRSNENDAVNDAATSDLIDSTFDCEQEREADVLSIDYVIANNYDPWAAIRLHEKLLKIAGGLRLPFLSSHPSRDERIKNLKALIQSKQSSEWLSVSRQSSSKE
jgi:predicted Zn-dependent protease